MPGRLSQGTDFGHAKSLWILAAGQTTCAVRRIQVPEDAQSVSTLDGNASRAGRVRLADAVDGTEAAFPAMNTDSSRPPAAHRRRAT